MISVSSQQITCLYSKVLERAEASALQWVDCPWVPLAYHFFDFAIGRILDPTIINAPKRRR